VIATLGPDLRLSAESRLVPRTGHEELKMPFKRIICPLDFSKGSLAAFETAVEMAQRDSAELLVLHVIEGRPVLSEWFPTHSLGEMTVRMEEKAHQAVNTLLTCTAPKTEGLATIIVNGIPFVEILKQATTWKADLIVLGAIGATSVEEIFFGSTAERVLRAAACSVLVVRHAKCNPFPLGDEIP
jgi:nucleotide-binding universal stress UspA family protein